jgi:hypothetical protein
MSQDPDRKLLGIVNEQGTLRVMYRYPDQT